MSTGDYTTELQTACQTVQRAAYLTKQLLDSVDKGSLDKSDATPVTIADFAAQALIIAALHGAFPGDGFVGEEDSSALRDDPELLGRTWELVRTTVDELAHENGDDQDGGAGIYAPVTKEEMLDLIDLGGKGRSEQGAGRVWVLDPVDGTATFMNGQQYAVCLALVEDGQQRLGVLGCPNLLLDLNAAGAAQVHEDIVDRTGYGVQLFAVSEKGASIRKMSPSAKTLLPAQPIPRTKAVADVTDLRFVDCRASDSTDATRHSRFAARIGAPFADETVTDFWATQMRYVALAVSGCNAMIKIPRSESYRSKLWDHAGGMLIAQEVGFRVTDLAGRDVDCGLGRTLAGCFGMVVAPEGMHGRLVERVEGFMREV